MATRMVKRLSQLEIDEVSLVDRPANQHGLVAIAKNDQEDTMPELDIFDVEGYPVDVDQLEPGDRVYAEDGREFVYTETDDDEGEGAFEDADDRELAGVGKGWKETLGTKAQYAARRAGQKLDDEKLATQMFIGRQGPRLKRGAQAAGRAAGKHVSDNRYAYGAAGGAGAGGYGAGRVGKSFGQEVLETLSKSLNDGERDVVIAKALDQVEVIAKRNTELEEAVGFLLEERDHDDFVELAKGYDGLPVQSDELADVLHAAASSMSPEHLQLLDRVLTGASEVGKSYFEVIGYDGQQDSDVLAQVYGMADAAVVKNAEAGLTREQAVTALFSTNPEAYDQYELENRR